MSKGRHHRWRGWLAAAGMLAASVFLAVGQEIPLPPPWAFRPYQPPFLPTGPPPPPTGYLPTGRPGVNAPPGQPWPLSDEQIRQNLWTQFATDDFLLPFGIQYQVKNGVVTLTGRADRLQDKERAQADAYAAGARSVVNKLRVGLP